MPRAIPAFSLAARIKRELREHLRHLGYRKDRDGRLTIDQPTKSTFRSLHSHQRAQRVADQKPFLQNAWAKFGNRFAEGKDVVPRDIRPRLELVHSGTDQAAIFRLAAASWSIPVSTGYGRRLRFLVWDDANGCLIGVIGLTDPVFNLKVRDEWVGWCAKRRAAALVHMLDAFVVGAVPPYNQLLGGKLIASLLKTEEIATAFQKKYGNAEGLISGIKKKPRLAAITTASALGRSSVYNRLRLAGTEIMKPLGYTSGWGHFHLPDSLFAKFRELLAQSNHHYCKNNRFGDGPNWRMRAIREALKLLGLDTNLLCHGIKREVFFVSLAENAKAFLGGAEDEPDFSALKSVEVISELSKERWILPRASKQSLYKGWSRTAFMRQILDDGSDDFAQSERITQLPLMADQ